MFRLFWVFLVVRVIVFRFFFKFLISFLYWLYLFFKLLIVLLNFLLFCFELLWFFFWSLLISFCKWLILDRVVEYFFLLENKFFFISSRVFFFGSFFLVISFFKDFFIFGDFGEFIIEEIWVFNWSVRFFCSMRFFCVFLMSFWVFSRVFWSFDFSDLFCFNSCFNFFISFFWILFRMLFILFGLGLIGDFVSFFLKFVCNFLRDGFLLSFFFGAISLFWCIDLGSFFVRFFSWARLFKLNMDFWLSLVFSFFLRACFCFRLCWRVAIVFS